MSWKINKDVGRFSVSNSIHTHSLVTAHFTLTDDYVGDFGVVGNIRSTGYIRAIPTIYLAPSVYLDSVTTSTNEYILANAPSITGVLITSSTTYNGLIFDTNRLGVNVDEPNATLHILGDIANSLIISTSGSINTNILASNANGSAISLKTTDTIQSITLTNATPTVSPNIAVFTHSVSGNLSVSVSNKCMFSPQLGVSPNLEYGSVIATDIGTASFYIIGSVETALYASTEYDSGNTATVSKCGRIIADKSASIATLDLIAPTNETILARGMGFAGGKYCVDTGDSISRSMGAIGLYSVDGDFIPSQTTVSGTSAVKLRSTLGINTITPRIDECVLDINGPVIISNAQIKSVHTSSSTTTSLFSISISAKGNIVAAGYTLPHTDSGGDTYLTISNDKGETWSSDNLTVFNETAIYVNLIDICVYSSKTIVACGSGNVMFIASYSSTALTWIWRYIKLSASNGEIIQYATSMAIVNNTYNNTSLAIIARGISNNTNNNNLAYFKFIKTDTNIIESTIGTLDSAALSIITNNSSTTLNFSNLSTNLSTISHLTIESIGTIAYISQTAFTDSLGYSCILCCGSNGIAKIQIVVVETGILFELQTVNIVLNSTIVSNLTTPITISTYNAVSTYSLFSVFVSTGCIISTIDGGFTYTVNTSSVASAELTSTTLNFSGLIFVDVKATSATCAVAITSNFLIVYTTDAGITWRQAPNSQLNSGGDLAMVKTNLNSVSSIAVNSGDTDTLFITTLTKTTNLYTANILNGYLPNAVNFGNHTVLQVYGNTLFSGNITVSEAANIGVLNITGITRITSNVSSTSIDTGALVITGGIGVSGNINIGGIVNILNDDDVENNNGEYSAALFVSGGVYITKKLVVSNNVILHKTVTINSTFLLNSTAEITGITSLTGAEESTGTDSGSLVVSGGVGISGNINVGGTSSNIAGIVKMTSITNSTYANSTSTITGTLTVTGGVGISGNINVGGTYSNIAGIVKITSITDTTDPNYSSRLSINTTTGALVVTDGVGISGNLNVGGYIATESVMTALSYNATSDLRYKTDFAPIQYGIDSIMQMQPLSYAFKNFDIDRRHIGLIAQDVVEIVPEVVSISTDGTMSIAYMELIPILIKAIQQQADSITELRERINKLEHAPFPF